MLVILVAERSERGSRLTCDRPICEDARVSDVFAEKLTQWREYVESPWGRLRYTIVGEVLARETAGLGPLRVLDVGGGDAMDSLPLALAGHEVTLVDPTGTWLAEAGRWATEAGAKIELVEAGLDDLPEGEWDLVLCHYVLQYRPADADDVRTLASRVRPGGRLSVILGNPDGMVLRQLVLDGPKAALAEMRSDTKMTVAFDTDTRKIPIPQLEQELTEAGLEVAATYGLRIANDLLVDNAPKHDPGYLEQLLELERALHDREPFNRIGAGYQLVARKPA